VLTPLGYQSITRMAIGDCVMSFNVSTQAMEWKPVTNVTSHAIDPNNDCDKLYRMEGYGMDIVATKDHRMLVLRMWDQKLNKRDPIGYESVEDLAGLSSYRVGHKSQHTQFEHSRSRGIPTAGFNTQSAFKIVIPGLERVCDWWWDRDQQVGFLKFVGFWLGDGGFRWSGATEHRTTRYVRIQQQKGESCKWAKSLVEEVFTSLLARSNHHHQQSAALNNCNTYHI
jgi:hypothetical protein